jgi:hypothetical protein
MEENDSEKGLIPPVVGLLTVELARDLEAALHSRITCLQSCHQAPEGTIPAHDPDGRSSNYRLKSSLMVRF